MLQTFSGFRLTQSKGQIPTLGPQVLLCPCVNPPLQPHWSFVVLGHIKHTPIPGPLHCWSLTPPFWSLCKHPYEETFPDPTSLPLLSFSQHLMLLMYEVFTGLRLLVGFCFCSAGDGTHALHMLGIPTTTPSLLVCVYHPFSPTVMKAHRPAPPSLLTAECPVPDAYQAHRRSSGCEPGCTPFPPGAGAQVHTDTHTWLLPVLTASPAAGLCPHLVSCPAQNPRSPSTADKGNRFSGYSEAGWLLLSLPWVLTCKESQAELNSFDDERQGGGKQAQPRQDLSTPPYFPDHWLLPGHTTAVLPAAPSFWTDLLLLGDNSAPSETSSGLGR